MNIVYLKKAIQDLEWMKIYYKNVFPQGIKKAQKHFFSIESLLKNNPYIGHTAEIKDIREISIPGIPFSFIYRIKENRIEILRVWDERQES
jgi:plasmid stabilization system protein ParE